MKKVSIINLGCKVNSYESEALLNKLLAEGFDAEIGLTNADYYIVNTCAVTNEAEHKSRQSLAKILKLNPTAKIYVCGCSAELHPQKFLDAKNVDALVGTQDKLNIINLIKADARGNHITADKSNYSNYDVAHPTRTRANVKIQDGCNNFCTYCIIPYTRGRERSRTMADIKREFDIQAGKVGEIVITGINVAGFGKDLKPQATLLDVAKLFGNYPNVRFRFSSLEYGSIDEGILKELKKHPNFCPFFHLSLQSGNNEVLKKMNRHYTVEEYSKLIELIRKYFPLCNISTDVIVGFPTETEEMFADGVKNIKQLKFGNLHIFPYSKRDGTVASKWGTLNGEIIKARVKKLSAVAKVAEAEFAKQNIGKTDEVLLETCKDGNYVGYTKNYLKTTIKGTNLLLNTVYKVKIVALNPKGGVIGEIV